LFCRHTWSSLSSKAISGVDISHFRFQKKHHRER
jgi:hypothetical protein